MDPSSLCPSHCAENRSLGRDLASIPFICSSQPMSRVNHRCSPFDIPVPKDCQGLYYLPAALLQEKEHHSTSGTSSTHILGLFIEELHSNKLVLLPGSVSWSPLLPGTAPSYPSWDLNSITDHSSAAFGISLSSDYLCLHPFLLKSRSNSCLHMP